MEKHLWILRHATAQLASIGEGDFERNLSLPGREEARRVGQWLLKQSTAVDSILTSPSYRTQQTAQIVGEIVHFPLDRIIYEERIYEANRSDLFDVVCGLPQAMNSVLLIGHNPSLEDFLPTCLANSVAPGLRFSPATLVHITFPTSWQESLMSLGDYKEIYHAKQANAFK